MCLTQCACQETRRVTFGGKSKSGQQVMSSHPASNDRLARRSVSVFLSHWRLLDQRPLCGEDRGQDQTRVASRGLTKHTAGLSFTLHYGVGRFPSWRGSDIFRKPLFLLLSNWPRQRHRGMQVGCTLVSTRPMAFPVTGCQLCTRRREHTARPGTLQTRQP